MITYVYDPVEPIVETKYGKLRGYTYGGVQHFLGVRYAKARRFHMPEEPDSWEGVRNAKMYGPTMLQMRRPGGGGGGGGDKTHGMPQMWFSSEDCQYLNIWSPKHDDGAKSPVFVWMHGGGFFSGASMESDTMDGFNLAHDANVTVVSINHRLNLFAHLNLADYGPEFENSKNVGIADLVAALKWIHENIAAFGGDPDNVTLCGHSGGGGKVLCMYQIEEAKDYFTRGIVLSGVLDDGPETKEADSRTMAKAILDHMGIGRDNIGEVYERPFDDFVTAYRAVAPGLIAKGVNTGLAPLPNDYFKGFPISRGGFCPWSKDKDLMLASVLGEFNFKVNLPAEVRLAMTEEQKVDAIRERFGAGADELLDLFRAAYPDHNIIDLLYLDAGFRRPTCETARIHAHDSATDNTFVYLFAFNMPTEGRIPPWHGVDVAYGFWNSDKAVINNEPVYGPQNVNAMQYSFLNFIRCGNPNNDYVPEWKPFTEDHHYTMVIDKKIELKEAYDEALIEKYVELCPPLNFNPML